MVKGGSFWLQMVVLDENGVDVVVHHESAGEFGAVPGKVDAGV